MRRAIGPAVRQSILDLIINNGVHDGNRVSWARIAAAHNVSPSTVSRIASDFGQKNDAVLSAMNLEFGPSPPTTLHKGHPMNLTRRTFTAALQRP